MKIFTKNIDVFCDAIESVKNAIDNRETAQVDFEETLIKMIPVIASVRSEFPKSGLESRFGKYIKECNDIVEQARQQRAPKLYMGPAANTSANDATVSS